MVPHVVVRIHRLARGSESLVDFRFVDRVDGRENGSNGMEGGRDLPESLPLRGDVCQTGRPNVGPCPVCFVVGLVVAVAKVCLTQSLGLLLGGVCLNLDSTGEDSVPGAECPSVFGTVCTDSVWVVKAR
jgi:hypothetical protein